METVILAAGRGTGMKGALPPYYKPLLVVNGQPIVVGAAKRAWTAGSQHVVIVAAPENALPISQVMDHAGIPMSRYSVVIQHRPGGVGDALLIGLRSVRSDEVLVLLGDNVTNYADISRLMHKPGNVIGIQSMPLNDSLFRYTRHRTNGQWVEKVPVSELDDVALGEALVWNGPVKVSVAEITMALETWRTVAGQDGEELRLGPCFNNLTDVTTCDVGTLDINTPEAIPE